MHPLLVLREIVLSFRDKVAKIAKMEHNPLRSLALVLPQMVHIVALYRCLECAVSEFTVVELTGPSTFGLRFVNLGPTFRFVRFFRLDVRPFQVQNQILLTFADKIAIVTSENICWCWRLKILLDFYLKICTMKLQTYKTINKLGQIVLFCSAVPF